MLSVLWKNVKSSGNKIPQVSLSSVVTNKDLVSFSETESLALADITRSFGYKLKTEEHLSDRSCLTCARNFASQQRLSLNVFPVKNQMFLGSVRAIVDHQEEKFQE